MKSKTSRRCARPALGGILALTMLSTAHAEEKPYTQAGTGTPVAPPPPKPAQAGPAADAKSDASAATPEQNAFTKFFDGKIPEAIAKGKFSLNARLRYEWVEQSNFDKDAHAPTIRTRFGYTTAPLYGFQGMIEGENITVIGSEDFNAAGSNNTTDRPVVADPPTTELNQAWLGYTYTNWVALKGGRQRVVLDN